MSQHLPTAVESAPTAETVRAAADQVEAIAPQLASSLRLVAIRHDAVAILSLPGCGRLD